MLSVRNSIRPKISTFILYLTNLHLSCVVRYSFLEHFWFSWNKLLSTWQWLTECKLHCNAMSSFLKLGTQNFWVRSCKVYRIPTREILLDSWLHDMKNETPKNEFDHTVKMHYRRRPLTCFLLMLYSARGKRVLV